MTAHANKKHARFDAPILLKNKRGSESSEGDSLLRCEGLKVLSAGFSWKENASRFSLIAKAAKLFLATAALEFSCQSLLKRAKPIGATYGWHDFVKACDYTLHNII